MERPNSYAPREWNVDDSICGSRALSTSDRSDFGGRKAFGKLETKQMIKDLAEENPEALTADGFEEAFIGICRRFSLPPLAAYSYEKCIDIIMKNGASYEEAVEHFNFNVIGSWAGEGTPVFIQTEEI